MALTISQLDAVTQNVIVKQLFDNIFDSTPLLSKIMASGSYKSQNGGTQIEIPLSYAKGTGGWYKGADTLATDDVDQLTNSVYTWTNLYAAITLLEEDLLKNSGNAAQLSLLSAKSEIAKKTLKDDLATGLYSDGTDSKSIVGLADIIAVDQTVGGISQTDFSFWQAQVDSTSTTMSLSALNAVYQDCDINGEGPDLIVSTKANYNRYYNLLQPQQRFMDTSASTAKGGFSSLMFNGKPWISDTYVPTNNVMMINLSQLHLFYHPERNISATAWIKPTDQELKTSRLLWMGALGSSNNRMHGKLSALTA